MKFLKRISAVAVSMIMMCSIAEMNVFAASTKQDGLEVSITTDKENYIGNEKITATLSVKNTNTTDVTDVTMETAIPDGYRIDDGLSNIKKLETLAPNKTEELKVVYVSASNSDSTVENSHNDPEKQDSKNSEVNQNSNQDEISKNSTVIQESTTNYESKAETTNTGDTTKVMVIVSLIVISVAIGVLCFKNKKGKGILSIVLCVSAVAAVVAIMPFETNAIQSIKTITLEEEVTVDNEKLNVSAIVKYSLAESNQEVSENSENSNVNDDTKVIYDSLSKTLDCIIKNDFNTNFHYLSMYGDIKENLIENEIPRAVAKIVSYNIGDIKLDRDDTGNIFALVHTNFQSVDMLKLISEIEEIGDYRQVIVNKLSNHEYIEKDFDIQIVMILHDNIWYLYETPALNDVFMGGLYSVDMVAREEFFNEFLKEGTTDD